MLVRDVPSMPAVALLLFALDRFCFLAEEAMRTSVMTNGSPSGSMSLDRISPDAAFLVMELFSATSTVSSLAMGGSFAPMTVMAS